MNSSQPRRIKHTPEGSPIDGPIPLDVAELRRKLAEREKRLGTLTIQRAGFRVPWPLTERQLEQALNKALDKWVRLMDGRGWTLRGKPRVVGALPAYGTQGDWYSVPLLDQREIQVVAAFSTPPKTQRLEVYVASA